MISHQVLAYLNSNPFMKIAKVLNPITLNTIHPWSFPVRHLLALFRYLLNTYDHAFLTMFFISLLILNIFSHSASRLCPFPMLQRSPQSLLLSSAFGTSLGLWYICWSYPISIEFCIHLLLIKTKNYFV